MKKEVILNEASQLTAGRISRRQFIMTAIAAGATLPMAMSIATNAQAATPNKGGRLRQGIGYERLGSGGWLHGRLAGCTLNKFAGSVVLGAVRKKYDHSGTSKTIGKVSIRE